MLSGICCVILFNLTFFSTNIRLIQVKMVLKMVYTLVFIKKNNEILLGLKTRGLGVGLWNGFGGKVEKNETIMKGAERELIEESNIEVQHLEHVGIVVYEEEGEYDTSIVHIFTAKHFNDRNMKPSEEMNPIKWYNYKDIPYSKMWPDAKLWYPLMLKDQYFSAVIRYGCNGNIINTNVTPFKNITDVLKNVDIAL